MFLFTLKKLTVKSSKLKIDILNSNTLNPNLFTLLKKFEDKVCDRLDNQYDFKYVQSTIGANKLFNKLKKILPPDHHVIMITQHPSYTSGILINDIIPKGQKGNKVFAIYFIAEFGDCWLNSQTKPDNLIRELNQLLKISVLKKDFEISLIEIYGSDRLNFIESQIGASQKRWKLKK